MEETIQDLENSELTPEEMVLAGVIEGDDFMEESDDLELNGEGNEVGRWGRRPRRFANGRSRKPFSIARIGRNTSASRFRREALERIGKMSKEVQRKLLKGQAQISDMVYYATAEFSGGKTVDIIDESVNRKLGITNLDGGKIDKDKEFILSAIKFSFSEKGIDYSDALPQAILNGEFELQLDGKKVLDNMPMHIFSDGVNGYNVNKQYAYYVLNNPKHIKPQTTIELEVKATETVAEGHIRASLIGTSVKPY